MKCEGNPVTMRDVLQAAVDAYRDKFEGDPNESNCDISGADFLDWFAMWRREAAAALAAYDAPPIAALPVLESALPHLRNYAEDWRTGLADGTYEDSAGFTALQGAISAAESLITPPTSAPAQVRAAVAMLRQARDLLKAAGASRAVDKVRLAMKSAEGAERHAIGMASRPGAA